MITRWKYFTRSDVTQPTVLIDKKSYKKSEKLIKTEKFGTRIALIFAIVGGVLGMYIFLHLRKVNYALVVMFLALIIANAVNYFRLPKDIEKCLEEFEITEENV